MNTRLRRHLIVAIVLLAAGTASGELYFRYIVKLGVGKDVPLARELASIPLQLGDWRGQESPIAPDVLLKIGAMDTLRRSYVARRGNRSDLLELYIAYFGGVRGTAPHHPDVCMPGAGWDILGRENVPVRVPGFAEPILVHKDIYEHRSSQAKRLVVWWEYVHGENVASHYMQRLKWALPGFLGGKRGSVLQVQIAAEYGGADVEHMSMIEDFMTELGSHLAAVLPKTEAVDETAAQ